jgi:MFS family permease
LFYSFFDGAFYSVMFGFGDTYLNPYAVALNATPREIGLFSSVPSLMSSLAQYVAPRITERLGRKRTFLVFVFLHAVMWIPILILPYVFRSRWALWLILFATFYNIFATMGTPAWASVMAQYIPEKTRGKYFAFRTKSLNYILLAASLAAGAILYFTGKNDLRGFTFIFAAACACRFLSWFFLTKMYEPRLAEKKEKKLTFREFLTGEKTRDFRNFAYFSSLMSMCMFIAIPFFPVYMLRELKFDYFSFVIINTAVPLFMLFAFSSWGKHADRFGNASVIRLTGLILPVMPVLWLFSQNRIYIFAINAFAGLAWAGYALATSNYIYESAPENDRVSFVAYYTLLNGVGLFLGPLMAGYLIPYVTPFKGSKYLTMFLISGIARLIVWFIFAPRIKEVRQVSAIGGKDLLLSVAGIKPMVE